MKTAFSVVNSIFENVISYPLNKPALPLSVAYEEGIQKNNRQY
jgi:hypothetical protein